MFVKILPDDEEDAEEVEGVVVAESASEVDEGVNVGRAEAV